MKAMEAVKPLHEPMGKPGPVDWLANVEEAGQTFQEYIHSRPSLPEGRRRVLYIQPLGAFTQEQRRIVALTGEYMKQFFNLPVVIRDDLPLSLVPKTARRPAPGTVLANSSDSYPHEYEQLLTGYVLKEILRPRLPEDAAALIAFTASDLWPSDDMNFVFGQASFTERVGVWSLFRFGNPSASADEFRLCLLRTMKLATHETGHMFSMRHCTKYECNMSGTNHLAETDRRPVDVCPECMAKVCWATAQDPRERYERLAAFCAAQGLKNEQRFFEAAARAATRI